MKEVTIYTLRGCPYCVRAKALLGSKGSAFAEIDVSSDPAAKAEVQARTGHRTFPQVFVAGEFVGGCDDLHALDREGRLDPLLA